MAHLVPKCVYLLALVLALFVCKSHQQQVNVIPNTYVLTSANKQLILQCVNFGLQTNPYNVVVFTILEKVVYNSSNSAQTGIVRFTSSNFSPFLSNRSLSDGNQPDEHRLQQHHQRRCGHWLYYQQHCHTDSAHCALCGSSCAGPQSRQIQPEQLLHGAVSVFSDPQCFQHCGEFHSQQYTHWPICGSS